MSLSNQTLAPGVSFLSLPDTRFKSTHLTAALLLPLAEETASAYAILPHLLRRSCAAYPDMSALNRRLDELYGARISADVVRVGEQQALVLTAVSIDDRFALGGEPVAAQCTALLLSMLYQPALENGVFRTQDVEQERRCLIEQIEAEINEKRVYARHRCEQLLCAGEPYAVNEFGEVDRVAALTPATITAAWKRALAQAHIQWLYQGAGDGAEVVAAIAAGCAGRVQPAPLKTITAFTASENRQEKIEEMDVHQSKLVMGFRVAIAEPSDRVMAARLMNALWGGTPHSLLFRHVRERLSLCYYCASSYDRHKGVLLVDSGVETDKAPLAREEILRQLEAIQQGAFSEEDLASARRSLVNQFRTMEDLQSSRAAWYLGQSSCPPFLTPEQAATALEAVSKEEVCAAARAVHPVCVYLLQSKEETIS